MMQATEKGVNRLRYIVLGGAVVGAGILIYNNWDQIKSSRFILPKSSAIYQDEDKFEGKIGEWAINYKESDSENTLVASKGRVTITYIDKSSDKESEKADFRRLEPFSKEKKPYADSLEVIAFRDAKGPLTFNRADIDESRFGADSIKGVFDAGDKHYNLIRTEIRDRKQKELEARIKEISGTIK